MFVILIGFIAGIIGGMGIGGGTILIPSLVFFLGVKQQVAQSVNLIAFIPTSIAALYIHFRHKNIEKKYVIKLVVLGCIGAAAGAFIAVNIDSVMLKKVFGVFLFVMGVYELTSKYKKDISKERNNNEIEKVH
ncbi:MAG: sulfite exporter TauE/SafE family protein [Bacillota bacterium]